jgi:UDP-glucose 4-epimerase
VAGLVTETAAEHVGRKVEITHLPMRPGEVPGAVVRSDTSTLAPLGIDPARFVSLEDGIRRTVRWFAENWLPGWEAENSSPRTAETQH